MPLKSENISPVLLPNGQSLIIIGKIQFPAVLSQKRVNLTFYVIKDFAYSFLMGKLKAVISFGQKLLSVNPSCNVLLKDKIIIPPETEVIVVAKVKHSGLLKGFTGFFTPKVHNHNKVSYIMPEELVTVKDNRIPITIANYTAHPMYLFKNTNLGTFHGLTENDHLYSKAKDNNRVNTPSYGEANCTSIRNNVNASSQQTATVSQHSGQGRHSYVNPYHINKQNGKHIPKVSHLINFNGCTLDEKGKQAARDLCDSYSDIFATDHNPINTQEPFFIYDLSLKDKDKLIQGKYYRVNPRLESILTSLLQDMIDKDIIEESNSCHHSPILVVRKPKYLHSKELHPKMFRVVQDARLLNKELTKHFYPLKRCIDVMHNLAKGTNKVFSILDMENAFHQIGISPSSRYLTAFRANSNNYQYKKMAQGHVNSSFYFQRSIDIVIRGLLATQAYQDDLTVGSQNNGDHFSDLKQLFERLRKYRLKIKPSKLNLFRAELEMFGFTISEEGIKISESRCQALNDLKPPTSKRGVRKLLGMFQYFARHIPKYNSIANPLSSITSPKQSFKWEKVQNDALENLKHHITHPPLLATPFWDQPFELYTDSSDYGIGGMLVQDGRPVAFCNRLLTSGERN